jgi:general secretion pathway protein G
MRPVLVFAGVIAFVAMIGMRERRLGGIRETRATLLSVRKAVDMYMAENEGRCPENLDKVAEFGSFKQVPPDAWGRPLRLICPARHEGGRFELLSDGPDGEPSGLDRVE